MICNKGSKVVAAILTTALALSPVFTTPSEAFEGQDVESFADSWRYSEGEVICEEEPEETTADSEIDVNALSEVDPEELTEEEAEDYNAQMGSSEEELLEEESDAVSDADIDEAIEADGEETIGAKSATKKNKYWKIGGSKRYGYLKGIDVSYWQHNIDWSKVKSSDVDFAIIRCGYGSNTKSKDDSKFVANVKGCVKNGIPYGVYLYSYANTVSGAKNEANHALRLLADNGFHPDLPVYYDLEDKQVKKASSATIKKMATAFCDKLTMEGYRAGVYASLSWWEGSLSGFETYDKWIAQWNNTCTYKGSYRIWQCSSSGSVAGISGRVDADLLMQPKASMDSFMSGAYEELPSYVAGVSPEDKEAYVMGASSTATVAAKKGPGRGYYSASAFADGTAVQVTRSANGYLEITDKEGILGTGWVKSGTLVNGSTPRDFIAEQIDGDAEGITRNVLHSYDGNVVKDQWATVRGKVYYVTSDGTALTGRQTIDGKEYYLGTDGVAVSDKMVPIDGERYYLGTNGLITKNSFVKVGAFIYGFGPDGVRLAGEKVWIGCRSYILNSQGKAYIFKVKTTENAGYYEKAGSGKKGTLKKGTSFFVLRTSGKWSQMDDGYWIRTSYTKKTTVYPQVKPRWTVHYRAKLTTKTASRSGPGSKYIQRKTFKKNTTVTVIGTYGNWSKISSGQWLPSSKLRK